MGYVFDESGSHCEIIRDTTADIIDNGIQKKDHGCSQRQLRRLKDTGSDASNTTLIMTTLKTCSSWMRTVPSAQMTLETSFQKTTRDEIPILRDILKFDQFILQ